MGVSFSMSAAVSPLTTSPAMLPYRARKRVTARVSSFLEVRMFSSPSTASSAFCLASFSRNPVKIITAAPTQSTVTRTTNRAVPPPSFIMRVILRLFSFIDKHLFQKIS